MNAPARSKRRRPKLAVPEGLVDNVLAAATIGPIVVVPGLSPGCVPALIKALEERGGFHGLKGAPRGQFVQDQVTLGPVAITILQPPN